MPEMDDKRLHEEIIGRKEVFRGALVRVEHWDARLASGRTALREIVKNYNAAAIVPVDADGRVTLVRLEVLSRATDDDDAAILAETDEAVEKTEEDA